MLHIGLLPEPAFHGSQWTVSFLYGKTSCRRPPLLGLGVLELRRVSGPGYNATSRAMIALNAHNRRRGRHRFRDYAVEVCIIGGGLAAANAIFIARAFQETTRG